jgi:Ni,Fe-hydrogenase I cytochrome b subunit
LTTVLLHWSLVFAFAVSLATGLRIAADAPDANASRMLVPVLPQGDVLIWHLGSGILVLGLMLAYVLYQCLTGLWRRLVIRMHGGPGPAAYWLKVSQLLYWLAFALFALAVATGLMQYVRVAFGSQPLIEGLHRMAAWGLVDYLVLHLWAQIAAGGPLRLLTILLPRAVFSGAGAIAIAAGAAVAAALIAVDPMMLGKLDVVRVSQPPVVDGNPGDAAWQRAKPAHLQLSKGENLPGGETEISIRGLFDDERMYLLCEWSDPTRSGKHVPLVKTADGWKILQTAYRRADENRFYEDKLALMLAPANRLAAIASVHLGHRPLSGQPGSLGGRGLHYTTDGGILDVWHWKSVRNDFQHQADDNFFGPPLPAPEETPRERDPDSGAWLPRYTAGYRKDPPGTFSGYEMNWEYFDEAGTLPLRLPDDVRDVADLQGAGLSPDRSDTGQWWIELNDTRPYAAGRDDLPVGTVLPSVLPVGQLTGDRGDISARGRWAHGHWSLEMSRRLDTGSDKDVPIRDGTLLWVAVFDHSQTHHAYHLRPLRIRLGAGST